MSSMPIELSTEEQVLQLFDQVDHIITDCDGVLWLVNNVINNADKFITRMREKGKQIIFATNNSTKSRQTVLKKLHSLGFTANEEEIMVPSYVCGAYLKQRGFKDKVYVFGSSGIEDELKRLQINYTGFGPDPLPRNLTDFSLIELDKQIGAVIVGFDYEISYPKLIRACTYARQVPDDLFIATNLDSTLPTPYSHLLVPGTGAFVKAIETATSKKPLVMGKPEPIFFQCMRNQFPQMDPNRTLMIGDRLDTDIAFSHNSGIRYSLLVRSGVSSLQDVQQAIDQRHSHLVPTHTIDTLGSLLKYF